LLKRPRKGIKMMNKVTTNTLVFSIFMLFVGAVSANLFKNPNASLQEFCKNDSPRQTLIYLDQSIIGKDDADWFRDLQNKLKFLPSEPIKVLMIDAGDSRVKEIWSVCYPSMSKEQYKKAKDEESVFSTGVDKQLKNASSTYKKQLNSALAAPLSTTTLDNKPRYKIGSFPKKSIVEALYYDSGRYDLNNGITRVILFTDMVENSDHASPLTLKDKETAKKLAQKTSERYPVDFNNSNFYVYGIGYSHKNSDLNRNLQEYWKHFLNRSGAHLVSYHAQLNSSSGVDLFQPVSYSGVMKQANGSNVATKLRLAFAPDGKLIQSWFGIKELRYPLKGNRQCKGKKCIINANVVYGIKSDHMFRAKDVLKLSLNGSEASGTIGSEDDLTRTPDGNKFSMKVAFEQDGILRF
jgi:hypothetical protein